MNRKGIIISNPGELGAENYCEGVKRDVANYRSFLLSPNGGVWRESELEEMKRPSVAEVRRKIESLRNYGYVLVIFSGHGYHCSIRGSSVLELRAGEEIDSDEFREEADKLTLILDCCRKVYPEKRTMVMDSARVAKRAPILNPADCRKYYNRRINECSNGIIVMHSCDIDELSGDDASRGGYYSYSLLEESKRWARESDTDTNGDYAIQSVVQAHNSASPRAQSLSGGSQNPQIEKPRSSPYFPFCIVA